MPCYDAQAAEWDRQNAIDAPRLTKKVHDLTAMLCFLCGSVEDCGGLRVIESHPDLSAWWKAHKAEDAAKNATP